MGKPVDVDLQIGILASLEALLKRAGDSLKALVPALQTGLVKLVEGCQELQQNTSRTLAALACASPKPEALVKALCEPPLRTLQLEALAVVLDALAPPRPAEVEKEVQA